MITEKDEVMLMERFIEKHGKPSSGTYVNFVLNKSKTVTAYHMMDENWGRDSLIKSHSMGHIDTLRRTWRDVECPFCGAFIGHKCHNTKRRKYANEDYIELTKPHKSREQKSIELP
jgi:hypothetical protein